MNRFKNMALSLLLALPIIGNAAGMGVYMPISMSDSADVTLDYPSTSDDITIDTKPSAGFGLAFDTNIGKDSLFNYRLGLEYMKQEIDTIDGQSCGGGSGCEFDRINMVHTFGFGVLRTKTVRLWVGPRINLAYSNLKDEANAETFTLSHIEFGIAPAVGVNVNLGRVVSLGADLDYRVAGLSGSWEYENTTFAISESDSYSGNVSGATARFYVLFRFGERF